MLNEKKNRWERGILQQVNYECTTSFAVQVNPLFTFPTTLSYQVI